MTNRNEQFKKYALLAIAGLFAIPFGAQASESSEAIVQKMGESGGLVGSYQYVKTINYGRSHESCRVKNIDVSIKGQSVDGHPLLSLADSNCSPEIKGQGTNPFACVFQDFSVENYTGRRFDNQAGWETLKLRAKGKKVSSVNTSLDLLVFSYHENKSLKIHGKGADETLVYRVQKTDGSRVQKADGSFKEVNSDVECVYKRVAKVEMPVTASPQTSTSNKDPGAATPDYAWPRITGSVGTPTHPVATQTSESDVSNGAAYPDYYLPTIEK